MLNLELWKNGTRGKACITHEGAHTSSTHVFRWYESSHKFLKLSGNHCSFPKRSSPKVIKPTFTLHTHIYA